MSRRKSPTRGVILDLDETIGDVGRRRSPGRSGRPTTGFSWYYAVPADQPRCLQATCGVCSPTYADKRPFPLEESNRIEACYINVLNGRGPSGGFCKHHGISFINMLQTLPDGTVRDVYREPNSPTVNVVGFVNVRRHPVPCPHIPITSMPPVM